MLKCPNCGGGKVKDLGKTQKETSPNKAFLFLDFLTSIGNNEHTFKCEKCGVLFVAKKGL